MIRLIKQNTLQGINFQLEAAEAPKIKAGGSSNSNILNRYFESLAQDLALTVTFVNNLSVRADRIQTIAASQGAAYVGLFNSLSSRVDQASGYSQVLADMYSDTYVNTVDTTTNVDNFFGQATLPIKSSTDLLVQTDVYGNKFLSDTIEFSYVETTAPTPPSNGAFQVAIDGLYMIRGDQEWLRVSPEGTTQAFVKLKAPLQFRGLIPNVLELWPLPVGLLKLSGVWYQVAGTGADGTWTELDLSYLPGYTTTPDTHVPTLGPVRIHLPNLPISQIAIALDVATSLTWGIHKLKVYHTEYESTGTLVVKDPYSRSIGDVLLRGKDPSDLSNLTIVKAGNEARVTLSSTNSTETPVITGVILDV